VAELAHKRALVGAYARPTCAQIWRKSPSTKSDARAAARPTRINKEPAPWIGGSRAAWPQRRRRQLQLGQPAHFPSGSLHPIDAIGTLYMGARVLGRVGAVARLRLLRLSLPLLLLLLRRRRRQRGTMIKL